MDDRLTAVAGSRGGVFTSAMAAVVDNTTIADLVGRAAAHKPEIDFAI